MGTDADDAGVIPDVEDLGTPHKVQTVNAVGLEPGAFLFPHTSHSHVSPPTEIVSGVDDELAVVGKG